MMTLLRKLLGRKRVIETGPQAGWVEQASGPGWIRYGPES